VHDTVPTVLSQATLHGRGSTVRNYKISLLSRFGFTSGNASPCYFTSTKLVRSRFRNSCR
jgi:hypothetical protein